MRTSILHNKEAVVQAAQSSTSISDALDKLGLRRGGGNFEAFKAACARHGVEYPKFDRSAQMDEIRKKTPLKDILVENSTYRGKRQSLLKRLQKLNLLETHCRYCKMEPVWNNKPLVLHLDHINGNSSDNRLENLRPLCPNCHSQTETFCGKNTKK